MLCAGLDVEMDIGRLHVVCEAVAGASLHTADHLTFGHLALLNGLLSSASLQVLCQTTPREHLPTSATEDVASPPVLRLLAWLFLSVCDMTKLSQHHFHTFQLMAQWFARLSKLLPQVHALTGAAVFPRGGPLLRRALEVVWSHLDSPVEGVNEFVMACFRSLLRVVNDEEEEKEDLELVGTCYYTLLHSLILQLLQPLWRIAHSVVCLS